MSELGPMHYARKQVRLSEQDLGVCWVWGSSRRLRGDLKETFTGTFMCSALPPPRPQWPTPSARGSPRRWAAPTSVHEAYVWSGFVPASHYSHQTTQKRRPRAAPSSPLLLSHIRASRSSTATTDANVSTSQPRSRRPPLISALNLVLLSGLCLYPPSEVSHFRKIRQSRHAA